ncbi:unnamed protein product [Haemonchus placei]|uniref:Endo/exonuclease/phosphatase domain-containing protein n=1 Tax=Haemonchus placei TaxID=6290 RepID=A0A158QKB6_HAEPC|nr:unnamed protein product [Haemonchus placei]
MGVHGIEWNEHCERLSESIMSTHTIHDNSQFQKPSKLRWTWESPGGQFHNEIDHIIFNRRFCLTDVAFVPKFYTGSDHRLFRARFRLSVRGDRAMKFRKRRPKTFINWDLKGRRAAVMDEAAEAGKSIRKAQRSFANYKTKMTSLRRPDRTVTASRREMEKVIYDFYWDLYDNYVYLPTHYHGQDEYIAPSILLPKFDLPSRRGSTVPGPDRMKPEYLESLPHLTAHRALLCTFTIFSAGNIPWDEVEYAPNTTLTAPSEGGCLKQCLEDFPECGMVITDKVDELIYCFLCYVRAIPLHNASTNVRPVSEDEYKFASNATTSGDRKAFQESTKQKQKWTPKHLTETDKERRRKRVIG